MAERVIGMDAPTMHSLSVGPGISAWLGLRYAEVARRFGRAHPAEGQLHVDRLGEVPIFPQNPSRLRSFMGDGGSNPQSENAHFLNIWAPDHAENMPVLFFIHGGAWMTGGGSQEWYNGARLAALGMVVVTVNYRLGPIGHLGDQSALELPLPLEDLVVALRWVHAKISTYGGDPNRITVVGQSAGGWYGHALSVLESTRGMIYQVAHLSMGTRAPWSQEHQQRIDALATQAAASSSLHQVPVPKLLAAGGQAFTRAQSPGRPVRLSYAESGYLPVATPGVPEGFLDPQQAALMTHAKAVYLQWTEDETAAFFWNSPAHINATQHQVDAELRQWCITDLPSELIRDEAFDGAGSGLSPYQQLVAASSWNQFQRFPAEFAQHLHAAQTPTQVNRFTYASPLPNLRSAHCFDLPFQFGNWEAWQDAPMLQGISREEFDLVSEKRMSTLADFVRQQHHS